MANFVCWKPTGNLKENFENGLPAGIGFSQGLEKGKPEVVARGWQKHYMQTAKDKKPLAHPFVNETSWTGREHANRNHDDSANM